MDWYRLLTLIERYVVVQERLLTLNEHVVSDRRELEARSVVAQERMAGGVKVSGEMVQHHRTPVPETEAP